MSTTPIVPTTPTTPTTTGLPTGQSLNNMFLQLLVAQLQNRVRPVRSTLRSLWAS